MSALRDAMINEEERAQLPNMVAELNSLSVYSSAVTQVYSIDSGFLKCLKLLR